MANIARQARGINVVFGSDTANVTGLCISATNSTTSERIPVLDNNGVPVGTIYVPQYQEGNFEILVENTTNIPNIGDNFTIGTATFGIENIEQAWEAKGIKKLRLRGAALPV